MTARQEYWLVDPANGDHALVTGADQRDELVRQGWADGDEPADDTMVTIWREGIGEPGRVPASALRDLWSHRGWVAGPPPGSTNPADAAAAEASSATAAQEDPKPKKPAASGVEKE